MQKSNLLTMFVKKRVMNKEEFKKHCPKLSKAISDNQRTFTLYGINFRSHTEFTAHGIIGQVEDRRAFVYYKFPISGQPKSMSDDLMISILN